MKNITIHFGVVTDHPTAQKTYPVKVRAASYLDAMQRAAKKLRRNIGENANLYLGGTKNDYNTNITIR